MERKYRNRKQTVNGIRFDSMREAARYKELLLMQKAGVIKGLELQVRFVLIPEQRGPSPGVYRSGPHKGEPKPGCIIEKECCYIADFVYLENGAAVVEDAKGVRTREYIIKRKLMLERYGIRVREV